MKLINKISNVGNLLNINKEYIVFLNQYFDCFIHENEKFSLIMKLKFKNVNMIKFYDEQNIIVSENYNELYLVNLITGEKSEFFCNKKTQYIEFINNNLFLCSSSLSDKENLYNNQFFNKNNNLLFEFKDNFGLYFFTNSILIFCNHKFNICRNISIDDGIVLWEYDIGELARYTDTDGVTQKGGHVSGDMQLCENLLIAPCTGGNLIALHADTGQLAWHKKLKYYQIKIFNNFLYVFSRDGLFKCNPINGDVIQNLPVSEKMQEEEIFMDINWLITEKYIYTAGRMDTIIAQWDRETGALVWKQRLYPPGKSGRRGVGIPAGNNYLQYANNHLYVLDAAGVLHVYEEE